jgi:hypothetical protein
MLIGIPSPVGFFLFTKMKLYKAHMGNVQKVIVSLPGIGKSSQSGGEGILITDVSCYYFYF